MTTPAAIQVQLASIKRQFIDNEDQVEVKDKFLALISTEILLRGVLVSVSSTEALQGVVANAGKQILDESSLPKTLLATMWALMGRLCEVCLPSDDDKLPGSVASEPKYQEAVRRCQDVEDHRLLCLLKISTKQQLQVVAQTYYLHAASYQPDVPAMWKKASEVAPSIYAVEQLRRVVLSKGNEKRAAELGVKLLEYYLDRQEQGPTPAVVVEGVDVAETFGVPSSKRDPLERARSLLQENRMTLLSADDQFTHNVLALRLLLVQERIVVQQEATKAHQAAKNRVRGIDRVPPVENFVSNVQRQRLAADDLEPTHAAARDVTQALLKLIARNSSTVNRWNDLACKLLGEYVHVAREQAYAVGLANKPERATKHWTALATFVRTLIESERISKAHHDLGETAALMVYSCHWMQSAAMDKNGPLFPTTVFQAMETIFKESLMRLRAKQVANQLDVVKAAASDEEIHVGRIDRALLGVRSILAMNSPPSKLPTDTIFLITSKLLELDSSDPKMEAIDAELGVPFFACLVAWSGLHRSPWQFATQVEAKTMVHMALRATSSATARYGRSASPLEASFMDVAHADAECVSLSGGLIEEALSLYTGVKERYASSKSSFASVVLKVAALGGLARIGLRYRDKVRTDSLPGTPEDMAREALSNLEKVELPTDGFLLHWTDVGAASASVAFRIVATRQLLADALLEKGNIHAAREVLEKAAAVAPSDPDTLLALGAFRLRLSFTAEGRSIVDAKAAQAILIKSAKADSTRPSPFALLGYWYESANDRTRAVGCYSKALLLDPGHPVAGRGLLRLEGGSKLQSVLDSATSNTSALTGWAWLKVGEQKAADGEDELACVSLMKGLRSRDVERPEADTLCWFYSPSSENSNGTDRRDFALASTSLADCHRRRGRYTAALRCYLQAIECPMEESPSLLNACAEVELKLGMLDEASDKFVKSMSIAPSDSAALIAAQYGAAATALAICKQDMMCGKIGSAFATLQKACRVVDEMKGRHVSALKLAGDAYMFGSVFPADLFISGSDIGAVEALQKQLDFIAKGAERYREASDLLATASSGASIAGDEQDINLLKASLIFDRGCNYLLRAQLASQAKTHSDDNVAQSSELYQAASSEFIRALHQNPLNAPTWCGLGCATWKTDVYLAQHAFSRALELDNLSAESYTNLSFLYTANQAIQPSQLISEAVTQVADTPMMWINRAVMLEAQAADLVDQEEAPQAASWLVQASESYRAALQVSKEPTALLGLALTTRIGLGAANDARLLLNEYIGRTGSHQDAFASLVEAVMILEHDRSGEVLEQVRTKLEGLGDASLFASLENELGNRDATPAESEPTTFPVQELLSDQVILQPYRGDLWLSLAKEMIVEADGGPTEAMRQCLLRAVELFRQDRNADARDLSKALSLQYWLATGDTADLLLLQEALWLDPTDAVARAALTS